MPPKGYQSAGEPIMPVGTRIPQSWFPIIEAHIQTLRRQNPALRVSQSDALRDLIRLGIQSLGKQLSLFEDTTPVEQAPPGASAFEQAAVRDMGETQPVTIPPVEYPTPAQPPQVGATAAQPHRQNLRAVRQRVRALWAQDQYHGMDLREFGKVLFDMGVYRARSSKTGEEVPVGSGTLSKWLRESQDQTGE
jgi:hypothetical protein